MTEDAFPIVGQSEGGQLVKLPRYGRIIRVMHEKPAQLIFGFGVHSPENYRKREKVPGAVPALSGRRAIKRSVEGGAMHLQEPGDFRHRLLFLADELARVRDLLG